MKTLRKILFSERRHVLGGKYFRLLWVQCVLTLFLLLPVALKAQHSYYKVEVREKDANKNYSILHQGLFSDAYGNLVVSIRDEHTIQKLNNKGDVTAQFGSEGSADGQFRFPSGSAVDRQNNIYVADKGNHRIQKFNSKGKFLLTFGSEGAGNGQFNNPVAVAIDKQGNVYVADYYNHRIQKFRNDGKFLTSFGTVGSGAGQFNCPESIVVDHQNNLYVADKYNHRIHKFDSQGKLINIFGSYGSENGQFNGPAHLALDDQGNLYVADYIGCRVQKFDDGGKFLSEISEVYDGPEKRISGLAVDKYGHTIYVADNKATQIKKFVIESATLAGESDYMIDFVHLYPNPAKEKINVGLAKGVQLKSAKLKDAYSKQVFLFATGKENVLEIDTHQLSEGLYFLEIHTNKGKITKRFFIQP